MEPNRVCPHSGEGARCSSIAAWARTLLAVAKQPGLAARRRQYQGLERPSAGVGGAAVEPGAATASDLTAAYSTFCRPPAGRAARPRPGRTQVDGQHGAAAFRPGPRPPIRPPRVRDQVDFRHDSGHPSGRCGFRTAALSRRLRGQLRAAGARTAAAAGARNPIRPLKMGRACRDGTVRAPSSAIDTPPSDSGLSAAGAAPATATRRPGLG